jgi:hypothetical protein
MLRGIVEYFVFQWDVFLRELMFGATVAAFIMVGVGLYCIREKARRQRDMHESAKSKA